MGTKKAGVTNGSCLFEVRDIDGGLSLRSLDGPGFFCTLPRFSFDLRLLKLLLNRGFLFPFDFPGGVFLKGGGQCVCVFGLEEHQVFGDFSRSVFLQRVIHAVFAGHPLKGLDIAVCDLDIGHALSLPHQLSDRLTARGSRVQFLLLPVGQILGDGDFQPVTCEFDALNRQSDRSVFNVFLHDPFLLFKEF